MFKANNVLNISNISKSFINRLVLDNINLEVKEKNIFGFIGLNGQGKTTLIKIILDLLDKDSGQISIFHINSSNPIARKDVFYLPEKFQPSPHLSGKEFLKFALGFYQKKLDLHKAENICNNLDLDFAVLSQPVKKYSKGMTQKLGLLALFLSEADLVILDEPMSGLDPKSRINLKNEMINYKKLGKTIFFSSHILSDMDEICDEIAVLNNSKIIYKGTPKKFKTKFKEDNLDKAFLKSINQLIN